ncbi:MAG: ABC transporter ATP-binding protein/permease [Clostridia bacterium]|nr:ABC transporter ATP-binding protein/permease [Clostridia bacterium]
MLKLQNIIKEYRAGEDTVQALRGVSTAFRENEFVAILGPSGCGKTTLLNIIGGLDQYTSGDLIINGVSTKQYRSSDWDTYRNHSIGFVFQSYNLIPHQSVLANVELSLTLTGVSRSERRARAKAALEKVGLGDQLRKKPNQMSGGQMQRVAIARALVNNPDILLADEPTGALDSETSVQIMEILKEIAKDKLIIMVTHNPDLAQEYASRTIRLLDGQIVSDTDPYEPEPAVEEQPKTPMKRMRKPSMSFFTALSLSLNNLMTKKGRTFMTSFAGSIGIIGIALILALSSGLNAYINKVEEDTLSSYPIALQESTVDISDMITSMMGNAENQTEHENDKIYSNNIMTDMIESTLTGVSTNNLEAFKAYLEETDNPIAALSSAIQYTYSTTMNVYKADTDDGIYQVNPAQVFDKMGMPTTQMDTSDSMMAGSPMASMASGNVWQELLDNPELLKTQYDVIAGTMPTSYDEIVLMVDEHNEVSDYTLYALGILDAADLKEMFEAAVKGEEIPTKPLTNYTYDEILSLRFKLLVNTDYYEKGKKGKWTDRSDDEVYLREKLEDATELKVVGILRPAEGATVSQTGGTIGYRADLMQHLVNEVNKSEIVKAQKDDPDTDILTGLPFDDGEEKTVTMADIQAYIATRPPEEQAQIGASIQQMQQQGMTEEQICAMFAKSMNQTSDATYDGNLLKFGVADLNKPSGINIYPKDFAAKDEISDLITAYNEGVDEADTISYTDYVGLMMSSVTTIINAITIILIAFVAISLVVSSIMIGIITYISVLERTKEIGILRAMGASKRDISRVFNAETMIVGFTAGALGIGVTLLLVLLANAIIYPLTGIPNVAALPLNGAVILVIISMALTLIAGLIPSRVAARKDPVVALRTE